MKDDRLISLNAAIDALNEYFSRIGKLKRRGLSNAEKAISLDTVGAIKSLPSAQQWIPCTPETMPKMTDTYLVQVGINENGEGMHTEARTADWNAVWQTWYVHTTRCLVGDIIKWMPIPWEGSNRHK